MTTNLPPTSWAFLLLAVLVCLNSNGQRGHAAEIERLSFNADGTMYQTSNGQAFQAGGWNWGHWGMTLPGDAQLHISEGANIVRIILRWWGLYGRSGIDAYDDGAPGHINATNLALLDQMIQWCADANLWINLAVDSNCGQNGMQNLQTADYCNISGVPAQNFWNNLGMRAKFKEVWTFVASRYKNVSRIAWYEILPEPSPPPPATNADVSEFYQEMIPVLRAVDPITPILIGPNGGYSAPLIATVYNSSYTNVVYTADFLDPVMRNTSNLLGKLNYLIALRNATGAPMFIQQAGDTIVSDPNATALAAGLQILINNKVGFTGWEYRGPSYYSYSVWWENGTQWSLKTIPYDVYLSKFASWSTPLNSSTSSTTISSSTSSSSAATNKASITAVLTFFICALC